MWKKITETTLSQVDLKISSAIIYQKKYKYEKKVYYLIVAFIF